MCSGVKLDKQRKIHTNKKTGKFKHLKKVLHTKTVERTTRKESLKELDWTRFRILDNFCICLFD